ncbi:MAG: LPS-assembly protein LptD [Gemmatimonadaceae bacterium]|nr:LPS-assembly protein LptD [Chitinophagaceae bacterium]
MNNRYKVNSKYILVLAVTTMLSSITLFSASNYPVRESFGSTLTAVSDTIPLTDTVPRNKKDTLPTDSTGKIIQQTDTFAVKISKDSLDAPIEYAATDSMVIGIKKGTITWYNKASVKQKDINLDAFNIELDSKNELMKAFLSTDTSGARVGVPSFVQGENNMIADTIYFNTRTMKGYTRNTYTQQGEIFMNAQAMKKVSENEYFAFRGRFTTCDLDTPHFNFRAKKMKLVNQKLAVSGPIHPEFEGVPVPIYLPFGFFPLSQGRHSGMLAPQFTANDQFGIGLEGLGYYKVLSDNFDMTLRTDLYSYGGYRLNLTPTYRVRYRYQGAMTLSYQNSRILSTFGKEEFQSTKTFNVSWNHTVDSKARPGQTFSANVNAGSTKYNQFITNNTTRNFQNQLNSSIAYSKNWENKYNLTVTANHNQNNNTGLINLNLPTIGFTVSNFYPFQKKEIIGEPKWYEKLGIGLTTNIANQASIYDSLFSFKRLIDTMQWGARHNVPITLSLPSLGPLQIAPGVSFSENWYSRKLTRSWNDVEQDVDTTINKGFYRSSEMSFSLSVNTAVYGIYDRFKKTSRVMAIRHVMRPQISANYKPDLAAKDFYETKVDSAGRTLRFNYFEGTIAGPLSEGKFGGISFGLDNNLEMKTRSKTDTTEQGIKKKSLIDGFGFNGSYNFLADSFKLSTISVYFRSTLFEKINITAGTTLDPYVTDNSGFRRNVLAWQQKGKFGLGRITSGNISVSTQFKSKSKEEKKGEGEGEGADDEIQDNGFNRPMTLEEQQAQLQYVRNNPAEFADFNIPWSVNISYSFNFTRQLKQDYSGFSTLVNSSVNLSGDFNLTPKWKVGMSTYYDFKGSGLQNVTAFLSREMHCWQLSVNVYSGITKGFNITINPKSGLLRDLKINRSRYFYNQQY